MKRWLIVPALILLLGGCGNKTSQIPEVETMQITTPTEPALYEDTHKVEAQTGGAVKVYTIADRQCVGIAAMGDHYLMLGVDTITLLKGEELAPSVIVEVPGMNAAAVSIRQNGVAYHDKVAGSIVFLNEHLREVSELALPQTVIGDAYISKDWSRVYYCTSEGVAVLNVSTGITSVLLSYEAQWLGITGSLQEGAVLRCAIQIDEQTVRTIAIRSETGELLEEGEDIANLIGTGKMYFFKRQNGNKPEYIFGVADGQPCSFTPAEPVAVIPLPDADRLLQPIRTVYGVTLDCYELSTGKRIASVDLPDVMTVECVGTEGNVMWLTVEGELYRWDTEKSAIEDEKVYKTERFTRRDPDEEGLQKVNQRLEALEQYYGVEIFFWEETTQMIPWEYTFDVEYIPEAYEIPLGELERAMEKFPQDFFRKAAEWTKSGTVRIVLVRGVYGGQEGYDSAAGIQYNLDGEAYIALSLQEGLEQTFYHVLGHLADAKVLSVCNAYSKWDDLNPWDFKYDNDYTKNLDRTGTKYIEGEKRYFVDHYSMSFAVEDRARILEYACMPGNEEVFASKYMQKKLKTVCSGIREAFALPEGEYVWEQYIKK